MIRRECVEKVEHKAQIPDLVYRKPPSLHPQLGKISQFFTPTVLRMQPKETTTTAKLQTYIPMIVTVPGTTREQLNNLQHSHFQQNCTFPQNCNLSKKIHTCTAGRRLSPADSPFSRLLTAHLLQRLRRSADYSIWCIKYRKIEVCTHCRNCTKWAQSCTHNCSKCRNH